MNYNRYLIVITKEGMDAALQIASDPQSAAEASKTLKVSDFERRAEIILIFEKKYSGRQDQYAIRELAKSLHTDAIVLAGKGGGRPEEYWGVEMRRQITGGISIQIGLEESWFRKFRKMNPYKSAFYLLDIMINGKTEYGRFGEENKETIIGQNVLKDQSEDKKKTYKKLRKEMLANIIDDKEDPDEI
jgi:hypothetical protein